MSGWGERAALRVREERREWRRSGVACAVLLVLLAAFFAMYCNRFAGLRSGDGEFTGGMALLAGRLPYRDYFTAGPPLNTLKSALLLRVFGPMLLVSRVVGVVERLVLGLVLLGMLRRMVRPAQAVVATAVVTILSAGDRTDPIASYNHDSILWLMAGALMASSALRAGIGRWKLAGLAAGAGLGAALSLLTKQTVGAGAVLCLGVVPAVLLARASWRRAGWWLLWFVSGVAVPVVGVGAVLARMGVLRAALEMLFVTGPSAKAGHPGDFLLRTGLVASDNVGWIALGTFWAVLAWRPMRRGFEAVLGAGDGEVGEWPEAGWSLQLLGCGVLLLVAAEGLRRWPALHDASKSVVYAMEFLLVGMGVLLARRWWRDGRWVAPGVAGERLVLLFAAAVAVAVLLSLSWPAFEAMLFPGAGLVAALVLAGATGRERRVMYGVFALLILLQAREKLDLPFGFDLQDEGEVAAAMMPSTLPELAGMRLPAATVAFVDGTTALVRSRTCASETMFVYPEMSLLYSLAGRGWPTWSPSHNIDVVNDALARADAERVLRARPAVLVSYRESEDDLRGAERLWRRGGRSGQRELAAAVAQLAAEYKEVGRYTLRAGDPPITLSVRPDVLRRGAGFCAGSGRAQ